MARRYQHLPFGDVPQPVQSTHLPQTPRWYNRQLSTPKRRRYLHGHIPFSQQCLPVRFAYDRWKEVVNCIINKKINSFLLNQLCVIHLFEADYNLVIGLIFGRYMIHRLCDNQLFHPSQWGRPNRECEDVLMLKELTYQIANMR